MKMPPGYIELNMNNYNEDDVRQLNDWAIEAHSTIEKLLDNARVSGEEGLTLDELRSLHALSKKMHSSRWIEEFQAFIAHERGKS
jgi:hypothetical protein